MIHEFNDLHVFREKQFSVGIDRATGKYYVSFLEVTANRRSEFETYFELPARYVACIESDVPKLENFVHQCRQGLHASMKINV